MAEDALRAYPLDWPAGWPRTPADKRVAGAFKVSFARARDELLDELRLSGADPEHRPIISTNVPLRRDGLPYARPVVAGDDPGVALHFRRGGRPFVVACDKYADVDSNLRAIGLTLANLRAIERPGAGQLADRAYAGFAALPAPDAPVDWRAELGFAPGDRPDRADVIVAYRAEAKGRHPDRAGSDRAMARLNVARDAALREMEAGLGGPRGEVR